MTPEDLLLGAAIADLLLDRQGWCHRKVVSLRLLEGDRGRIRVSLDCSPPPDPRLAYSPDERDKPEIADVVGQVHLPVALVRKGVMRDLNVTDPTGQALPVLGRADDGRAAVAALYHLVAPPDSHAKQVLSHLYRVVFDGPEEAHTSVAALVGTRSTAGLSEVLSIPVVVQDLIRAFADAFLLTALLPAASAGDRQVIKYSAHWQVEWGGVAAGWPTRVVLRLGAAAGYVTAGRAISIAGAEDARSYHLEVHAPAGLVCAGLSLPAGPSDDARVDNDELVGSVAHAVAYYPTGLTSSDDAAQLKVLVPGGGLHTTAVLVTAFTATVFILAESLPGGRQALAETTDGAAAILLAAPAVALALLVRSGESDVAAKVLMPLRLVVLGCAFALVAAAASLVGQLHDPWITYLWRGSGTVAGLLALLLVLRGPIRAAVVRASR